MSSCRTANRSGGPTDGRTPEVGGDNRSGSVGGPSTANKELDPTGDKVAGGPVRIGLILGPSALRGFAYAGFLQEVLRQQVPIQAVVGFEMGALMGALAASKGQAFDSEWQLQKTSESFWVQKTLLRREIQPQNLDQVSQFLGEHYRGIKLEDFKIPFACPAVRLSTRQAFLLTKGSMQEVIPSCVAFAPLWTAYRDSGADVSSLEPAIQFLKQKGANWIVYLSVFPEKGSATAAASTAGMDSLKFLWANALNALERKNPDVNEVLRLPVDSPIDSAAEREDNFRRGKEFGKGQADQWLRKIAELSDLPMAQPSPVIFSGL